MADFRSCITEALQKGEIDADAAQTAHDAYDDAYASVSEALGPVDADRVAAERTMAKLEAEAIEARRRRQMTIRTRRRVLEEIAGYKTRRSYEGVRALGGGDGSGKPPKGGWVQGGTPAADGPGSKGAVAARALELMVENKPGLSGKEGPSIAGRHLALRGKMDAMMAQLIEAFETRTGFDRPGRAQMDNIVREAFGEDTGDLAAKAMSSAWGETAEYIRHAFNAAGGAIGKMEGWGLPQTWDGRRVRDIGQAAWVDAILPRLDRAKMVDRMTDLPFSEKRLKSVLGEVWQTIATSGASKRNPGERLGSGMLAARRGEERFLRFKSADDWMAVQGEFGEADPFQAMMGHLDEMARDVAQMQILGPNPEHQFEWLKAFALREAAIEDAAGKAGALDRAKGYVLTAEDMMAHFTGDASAPVNTKLSSAGVTTRAYLTGVTLGSAILSDMPSAPFFGAYARAFSGLDRAGDMAEFARLIASPAERANARRSGFIVEQATDGFVRAANDHLRMVSVGERAQGGASALARRLPAATLRLQGLTPYVAARKRAFRFEFMGRLDDLRGSSLAAIKGGDASDRAMGEWLDARGFTEADWTIIRAAPAWEPRAGSRFLRPMDVAQPELALRLSEAIEMETRFVSPETTLWTRAKLIGQIRPGTWKGEYFRSWAMFRGFTMTATHLYAEEMALRSMKAGPLVGPAMLVGHAAAAMTFLTLAGAAGIQIREMIKGNDPKSMTDPRFWGASLMQGGGLGIFGDFLYASQARNGQTAPAAAYGPLGQAGSDASSLTFGNASEISAGLHDGDSLGEAVAGAHVGRDATNIVRRYTPASSMWWMRTAFSRAVADNLQKSLDPEAEDAFERRRRRMERETGQGQWWPEGQSVPDRAPDATNAMRPVDRR